MKTEKHFQSLLTETRMRDYTCKVMKTSMWALSNTNKFSKVKKLVHFEFQISSLDSVLLRNVLP